MTAKNDRHEIRVFDISTSDGGDFPRIIEITLFYIELFYSYANYEITTL